MKIHTGSERIDRTLYLRDLKSIWLKVSLFKGFKVVIMEMAPSLKSQPDMKREMTTQQGLRQEDQMRAGRDEVGNVALPQGLSDLPLSSFTLTSPPVLSVLL